MNRPTKEDVALAGYASTWTRGKCMFPPACGDPTVRFDGFGPDASFCPAHRDRVLESQAKKRAEQIAQDAAAPRSLVTSGLDETIPPRYADVTVPGGTPEEYAAAVQLLRERVKVANLAKVLRDVKDAAAHLYAVRGAVVLLAGLHGTGKTTLMSLLLRIVASTIPLVPFRENEAFRSGGPTQRGLFGQAKDDVDEAVLWASSDDLFDAARTDDGLRRYKHVALAAIDDIGGEASQVNAKGVPTVVWKRHDLMFGTVLTTGFVDEKAMEEDGTVRPERMESYLAPLGERYGLAFIRRIAEPGSKHCRVIPLRRML